MKVAYRIIVTGLVQGVGFRYSAKYRASQLRVTGFVRNLRDGSVELVCEGEEAEVETLFKWASKGPPHATVETIRRTPLPVSGSYRNFALEY